MEDYAFQQAAAAGEDPWHVQALATLFSTADAIQPDEQGYTNGQHRAQTMLDAGVRRTVVLRYVWQPDPPADHR
jgi:hypothetical protein